MPDKIKNAPELDFSLNFFFEAFEELKDERSVGMGMGPISVFTIKKYCEDLELDETQSYEMKYHIKNMDNVYISFHNNR